MEHIFLILAVDQMNQRSKTEYCKNLVSMSQVGTGYSIVYVCMEGKRLKYNKFHSGLVVDSVHMVGKLHFESLHLLSILRLVDIL